MKIDGRRSNLITIEPSDNPQTVVAALREGAQWAARNLSRDDAGHWRHNAANAWETIEDGYGIYNDRMHRHDGLAQIALAPDQLELSLVAFGVKRLDENTVGAQKDVRRVDEALFALDAARLSLPQTH